MRTSVGRMVLAAVMIVGMPTGIQAQGPERSGLSQPALARDIALQPNDIGARAAAWGRQKVTTIVGGVLGAVAGYVFWRSVAGPDAFPDVRVLVITAAIGAFVGHVFGAQGPSTGNAST